MKHCPECNRNYADQTLSFCLQDGAPLIFGAAEDEPSTAILSDSDRFSNEQATKTFDQDPMTDQSSRDRTSSTASNRNSLIAGVIGIILVTALGVGSYFYYGRGPSKQIESVAVLPFENASDDPGMDYLSDGLSESLIDRLSQLPQLKVAARSSSFKFRGADIDVTEVSRALGVQAVIMGKLAKHGDELSVRVELIDAMENKHLWGEQYVRAASGAINLQRDIDRAVVEKLRLRLTGEQESEIVRSGTLDPYAYELMLKGRYFFNQATTESARKSLEFLEQAVARDPQYALATALLANSYRLNAQDGLLPGMTFERAEATARRALELDPGLSEAHFALAATFRSNWRYRDAETEYKRAIALDPNHSGPRSSYSTLLSFMKRHDEAIAEAAQALALDPLSPNSHDVYCRQFAFARRYDDLIIAARKWAELDQHNPRINGWLGEAFENKGLYDDAIEEYQMGLKNDAATEKGFWETNIAIVYAKKGDRKQAEQMLQSLERENPRPEHRTVRRLAALHILLGDNDAALRLLERAYSVRASWLNEILVSPDYDSIRGYQRFKALIRKMGLSEYE